MTDPSPSFAGSDSTASTMQSLFHHVLRQPAIYAKLQSEIDSGFSAGLVSRPVQYNEALTQLPYFQACIKEAMRLRPAVGLNMTRHVPAGGAEIDGKRYPGGTRVAVNGWVIHRDKAVFGDDADVYKPERWTESEERAKVMDRYMVHVRAQTPPFRLQLHRGWRLSHSLNGDAR